MPALDPFLVVMLYALLPALGNLMGGLLVEHVQVTGRHLSYAFHAAAGVLVAVVAVEVLPQSLAGLPAWLVVGAFVLGGLLFLALERTTSVVMGRVGRTGEAGTAWLLAVGVGMDLLADGLMIGAASSLNLGLALVLALGQVTADVPEGFATAAAFQRRGMSAKRRRWLMAAFVVPVLVGAAGGYFVLRTAPPSWSIVALTVTAGLLMTLVVEEVVPEAHEGREGALAALFFLGGFALFVLIGAYLG